MVTHIASRNFTLTSHQKNSIEAAVQKIEDQYPRLLRADVTITREKYRFDAEIVVHGKHVDMKAHGTGDSIEDAVGEMLERIESQVERRHDRSKEHHAQGISALEQDLADDQTADEQATADDEQ